MQNLEGMGLANDHQSRVEILCGNVRIPQGWEAMAFCQGLHLQGLHLHCANCNFACFGMP